MAYLRRPQYTLGMAVDVMNLIVLVGASVLALLMTVGMTGSAAPAELVDVDIPFRRTVLKNGLTLIVHEDHKAPIVSVNIWYHVGSKNERPGRTGFAHLFEHLMFNGSEHFNDDYFKLLEPEGATTLNGTTDWDRTNYFQDVPVSALDLVLWAESDRMGWLLGAIDQAKLDEQRGVVLNEKRQGENQPYGKVLRVLLENIFPVGHPYSWEVIGNEADIKAATLDDVREWFQTYYGAANAVICLAGDIDYDTAVAKVEKYFGEISPGPPIVRPGVWIAKRSGVKRATLEDRVKLPMILQVWNIPPATSVENDYLSLAGDVLSSGKSSRLYKRLVYDEQLAVSVSAYPIALEIAGAFGITAMVRPGIDIAKVEQVMDEELTRFLREGPTEEELRRAKNQRVASFVRGVERIGGFGGKSDILCYGQVFAGDPAFYKVQFRRMQTATREDVVRTAREWLSDGKFVLTVVPFPEYQTNKTELDRSVRPATGTPPAAKFPQFRKTQLSNGLRVILVENHTVPAVHCRLVVDAGYASDPPDLPGLASMTMEMLDEGTETRDALQISDELQLLGAELDTGANPDQCIVTLNALKTTLEESLDLYRDVILNPTFPEKELIRLKKERLASIQHEKVTPNSMALRVLPRLLYGEGHPYSAPLTGTGTEASTEKMTREDLVRYHRAWFKPGNATLIIVGDVTPDAVLPMLEAKFSSWRPGDSPRKNLPVVPLKSSPSIYIIDKPDAEQSVIFAAHLAPPKPSPEERAIEILNTILGGKFTSRVNMNLRESKHWTYGASTVVFDACGQRPFFAVAPVQTDKTAEAIQEIRRELTDIIGERPPTPSEVAETKKQAALELAGRWETMAAVAAALAEMVRFNYPDDYFATYAANIIAQTEESVARAAKILIQPDKLIWVIVGDRKKIEDKVRSLGYGNLEFLDASAL